MPSASDSRALVETTFRGGFPPERGRRGIRRRAGRIFGRAMTLKPRGIVNLLAAWMTHDCFFV